MKPVVIIIQEGTRISKEDFEKYINQAYEAGVEDGKLLGRTQYVYNGITTTTPNTIPCTTISRSDSVHSKVNDVILTSTCPTLTAESKYNKGGLVTSVNHNYDSAFENVVSDKVQEELSKNISNIRTRTRGQL